MDKFNKEGWRLGDVQLVSISNGKIIANCATQHGFGYADNQKVFVDYPAIASVFKTLVNFSKVNNISIAMPRIGAGLAGGDWTIIKNLLEQADEAQANTNITVYSL